MVTWEQGKLVMRQEGWEEEGWEEEGWKEGVE